MLLFVVNGKAGNGRGSKAWRMVEAELRRRGVGYRAIAAASAEETTAAVREALQAGDVQAVAAVGGDGTLHALLPLLAGSGIPLGLIPAGSGNDTARAFGIPRRPLAALETFLAGRTQPADLIRFGADTGEKRLALTSLAIGLDAAVVHDVNSSRYKRWCNRLGLGSLAYIVGLLRVLAKYKPRTVTVTVDGETRTFRNVWLSAVTNTSSYGGGLRINPDARPADGRLHVCVVHGCTALRLLRVFPTILNGSHVRTPYVTQLRGQVARIAGDEAIPSVGDGEAAGQAPIAAELVPAQLLFVAAAASG